MLTLSLPYCLSFYRHDHTFYRLLSSNFIVSLLSIPIDVWTIKIFKILKIYSVRPKFSFYFFFNSTLNNKLLNKYLFTCLAFPLDISLHVYRNSHKIYKRYTNISIFSFKSLFHKRHVIGNKLLYNFGYNYNIHRDLKVFFFRKPSRTDFHWVLFEQLKNQI